MTDDQDPLLTQLFAEQAPPAHGADFMVQIIARLERDGRRRRTYGIGAIISGVIVAALLAPWMAQVAALAVGSVATAIAATRPLLDFPMAGLMVSSLAALFLPVLYLGLMRRW